MNTIALQSIVFDSFPTGATMFVTVDDAKMNIPFPLAAKGEHYWTSVQMPLASAWFLVVYENNEDGLDCPIRSTIFVARAKDVVAIQEAVSVVQISLVTPGWVNESNGWKMDSLKEMWIGSELDKTGQDTATVCVTEGGCRRVISWVGTPDEKIVGLRRVF